MDELSTTRGQTALTEAQAETLRALASAPGPLSAYDVLEALRATRPSAGPPTAYRALARLEQLGLVHRLESINAYVPCCGDHGGGEAAFSICDDCGGVRELAAPQVAAGLVALAERRGFVPTRTVIELRGRCADCRQERR